MTLIKLLQGRTKLVGGLVRRVITSGSLAKQKDVQNEVFIGHVF